MTLSIPILNYGTKVTRTGLIIILRQSKESANHWQSHSAWTVCVVLYQHMVHNIVVAYNILFSRKYSQLGMPLQGLDEPSKLRLLEQLTSKAITLEEFKRMAESIKKKKRLLRHSWGIPGPDLGLNYKDVFPSMPLRKSWPSLPRWSWRAKKYHR